jgi:hypothetical protein
MPDLVGHTLGQYRIVEQIGLGGMATVYKAYQPALDRYVAVKVLPAYYAHEPGFAERFNREARAVAKLTHPHVLPIYDFGQEDGLSYIVMQYVDAGTLKDMLGQPISLIVAADVIEQIADALDYAHEQRIIHRDVKPSNVLMDRGRWVLLSDFGLAKMVEGSVQLTGSGVGVGTPAYMAPEQGQGLKVDRRADIYSLGIILYEMVTGRVPFEAETPMAIVVKHITEPLPLPHTLSSDLPESVERVIMKALAKDPDDRYESAGKMAAALRKAVAGLDTAVAGAVPSPLGVVGEPSEARTVLEDGGATQIVSPPAAPAPGRKGFPIWPVAVAGVLLLILLLAFFGLARRIRSERAQRAAQATQTAVAQAIETEAPSDVSGDTATPNILPSPKAPPLGVAEPFIEKALTFLEENHPVYEDDFAAPDSGWRLISERAGQQGSYEDGAYVIRVPEVVGQESATAVLLPLEKSPADFVLQVDLVALEGGPGANWAVEFRAQDESRLYAGLNKGQGAFGIGLVDSGTETALTRGQAGDFESAGVTQVMLVAIGPHIALYLDGERVGTARTELTGPGKIAFSVINTGDPMVAFRFDNVRVWDLTLPLKRLEADRELPFSEDFENGRADGWTLDPGWEVIQDEDGNHALVVEGHNWATVPGGEWEDFYLRFRVKPLSGGLHLNFRGDPADASRTRYLVHFVPDATVLHRFYREPYGPIVAGSDIVLTADQWNHVELIVNGSHIEILLDGQTVLHYEDPDPLPPGIIAFENDDPPARHLIDDVVIDLVGQ